MDKAQQQLAAQMRLAMSAWNTLHRRQRLFRKAWDAATPEQRQSAYSEIFDNGAEIDTDDFADDVFHGFGA